MSLKIHSSFGVNFVLSGLRANFDYRGPCSFAHLSNCLCIEAALGEHGSFELFPLIDRSRLDREQRNLAQGGLFIQLMNAMYFALINI